MPSGIELGHMRPGESQEVFRLIERCFEEYVKHDCTEEGEIEFFRAVRLMLFETPQNHINIVAREARRVVGVINVRDCCHICLFFVEIACHRRGIGRALFDKVRAHCRSTLPGQKIMDVNSSLFAVPFYEKLGFKRVVAPKTKRGIRFTEMRKELQA